MRIPYSPVLIVGAAGLLSIAYAAARRSLCSACFKPFAIWRIRGAVGEKRVCRSCLKAHDRRRRSYLR
jgi:hypothetical protein